MIQDEKLFYWEEEFGVSVMIADSEGRIVYMNKKAIETYASDGGEKLIGKNLQECHQPASTEIIQRIMREQCSNTYTIEKKGIKKLIHQAPWFHHGICSGIVELSIVLPADMPHFIRD